MSNSATTADTLGDHVHPMVMRFRNARKAIAQIRQGEWKPVWNSIGREHLAAEKGRFRLWLGNGSFFCDIDNSNYFGLVWRHWVWWAAARKLKKDADRLRTPEL